MKLPYSLLGFYSFALSRWSFSRIKASICPASQESWPTAPYIRSLGIGLRHRERRLPSRSLITSYFQLLCSGSTLDFTNRDSCRQVTSCQRRRRKFRPAQQSSPVAGESFQDQKSQTTVLSAIRKFRAIISVLPVNRNFQWLAPELSRGSGAAIWDWPRTRFPYPLA